MKNIFLLILFFTSFGCTRFIVKDSSKYDLTQEELAFLKSQKIGLIGFYPFRYKSEAVKKSEYLQFDVINGFKYQKHKGTENSNDLVIENDMHLQIIRFVNENKEKREVLNESKNAFTRYGTSVKSKTLYRYSAWFDKKNPTSKFLEFGDTEAIPMSNSIDTSIKEEQLKEFLIVYLSKVKHLGLEVLEPLLTISQDERKVPQMKKFDVDYWVIAYHAPLVLSTSDTFPQVNLSLIPHFFTGGIFPFFQKYQTDTRFFVFDKNLNHIKTFYCSDDTLTMTSFWVPLNKNVNILYEPQLKEFSKALLWILPK